MRFSDKKLKLGLYVYYSAFSLIIFILTAVCEQILPTQTLVKSLILFSCFVFIGGVCIYIVNQSIKKPIIAFILGALAIGLLVLYLTGDYKENYDMNIYNQYRSNLNKYSDTPERKDFELNTGIDDKGLIHATLWQTVIQEGLIQKDFPLMIEGIYIWWLCFNNDFYEKYDRIYRPVEPDYKFLPGDVTLINNHICVFYKDNGNCHIWMTCDKCVRKLYFYNKNYLDKSAKVYRVIKFCEINRQKSK